MLQKLNSVSVLGAVFLALTAIGLVQKINLGILASTQPQVNLDVSSDLRSNQIELERRFKTVPKIAIVNPKPASLEKPKVASQTFHKPAADPLAPADIEAKIRQYASEYGADPEIMLIIAKCESGFRAEALSPSGAYGGLYQFVNSTWQSNRRAMGLDENPDLRFNAEEAIKTAAFKMGRDGYGAWPVCSSKALASLSN